MDVAEAEAEGMEAEAEAEAETEEAADEMEEAETKEKDYADGLCVTEADGAEAVTDWWHLWICCFDNSCFKFNRLFYAVLELQMC